MHGSKAFVITWELEVAVSLREVFCLTVTKEMACFVLRNSEGSLARWLVWGGTCIAVKDFFLFPFSSQRTLTSYSVVLPASN